MFFLAVAPCRPITSAAVSSTAVRYLRRAGINVHRAGSHTLRHTCVQRLVDAEFSLKVIGDYVGHQSAQSTRIYTKLDVAALREVAMGNGEQSLAMYDDIQRHLSGCDDKLRADDGVGWR